MLNPPESILPGAILTIATIIFLAIGGGTLHAPGWVRDISYPCAIAAGWHAILADVVYLLDHTSRAALLMDALRNKPEISKPRSEVTQPDYIMIGNAGVERAALKEIAKYANGAELQPERRYTQNQLSVRNAHDALIEAGVIEKGTGNRGPRVRKTHEWEQIIRLL